MKFEIIPAPPTFNIKAQIRGLKKALMAHPGQWIRVRFDIDDDLSVDEIRAWRFGRYGELTPEVRVDTAMIPRWIDVRLPPTSG